MSAPNFIKENTKDYYLVELTDDYYLMEEDIKYKMEQIKEDLEQENINPIEEEGDEGSSEYNLTSYLTIEEPLDTEESINLIAKIGLRSGYYTGANLDYLLYYRTDTEDYENREEAIEEAEYEREKEFTDKEKQQIEQKAEEILKKIEKALRKNADKILIRTALFSNGEAIYEEIEKDEVKQIIKEANRGY